MAEATLIILIGIILFCLVFCKALQYECYSNKWKAETKITPTYTVLTVKNNEDCIEGVIYSIIKEMRRNNLLFTQNILVVDLGSKDNTVKIVERLSQKYEFIHILHSNSYMDMVGH